MIFLGLLLSFFLLPAEASTRPSPDQLAAMQVFLRAETRGPSLCPEALRGLPPENLARIPQMIAAEFRTRWDGMDFAAKEKFFRDQNRLDQCRARCRCDLYLEWIEEIEKPSEVFAIAKLRIESVRSAGAAPKARTCALANREWICRHPFFRDLVEAAKDRAESKEKD